MNETVRGYISQFRVRELQAVLEQLGLPKTGRKADLVARVFAFFGEEPPTSVRHDQGPREQWRLEAAERAITHTYQSMMGLPLTGRSASPTAGTSAAPSTPQRPQQQRPVGSLSAAQAVAAQQAATAAALAHSFRQSTPGKRPGGAASPFSLKLHSDKFTNARSTAIRCVCGDNADRGHMIQCEGDKCGVWQHSSCVGVNAQETPDHFFCEWCRVSLADPFWEPRHRAFFPAVASRVTTMQPPAYLTPGERPQPMLHVDRGFTVQPNDSTAFRTQIDIQLQAVCVQLGDPVPFRFHWPRAADLRANNMQYRPYGRNPNNKLGNNARDEPANIGPMCFSGKNRVLLTAFDERRFAFGVQLARKRTQAEVRDMMAPPLDLPAAIAAVKRAVTGKDDAATSAATTDAGSDSDDLEATSVVMSLRCPLSGSRIVTPARFAGVPGLGCFNLDTYLTMVERSRKWQCPHSMRNMTVQQLHVDTYATRLLEFLKGQPDVMEVEVNADGQWRCVSSAGDGSWTHITANPATVPTLSPVKQEAPDIEADTLSSSDDESEGAELRAAAMAYAASAKRKREPALTQQDEVIVLSSDSDEEASRPAQRHQTAPPSVSQNDNLLRIRLPHRDQQAQSQQRPMQQRTPQSTRQPTVAQAFSRAASHQQSQHQHQRQHQGQQPDGLLRQPQPNGWTGASQGARASTPQVARPNGHLAPAAPGSGSGRPDSGGAGPPQGMAATSAPQAAVPLPLPQQQQVPGQQQPAGVPAHRQMQLGQQGYGHRPPATSAPQQPPSSGPQRPMPQIPAHSGVQRSATPGHSTQRPPQQAYGLSQQQRRQQDGAWPRMGLPVASVPASAPAAPPVGWVPQSTASAPMQPYSQAQAQPAYQTQRQYQPYAPAQSSAPAAGWQHAASSAAASQPSPRGWPPHSAPMASPASTAPVATANVPSQALQRPPSQQQQQRAPQRQSTPQPLAYVWGTPESATQPAQPPLPPQPPPPLPGQQRPAPVQRRQPQPQQSQQQRQSGAGASQPSVHMSPEELAHEAQLAMLPDDMFDEFLADPEFSNALSAQPASDI